MKTKTRPSKSEHGEPINDRITILAIDGNSLNALAGSIDGDTLTVDAIENIEFEKLVEVSRRIRHPIFMDSDVSFYPGKDKIIAEYRRLMENPAFQNPVASVFPPDRIRFHSVECANDRQEITAMRRLLINKHLTENPNEYPCLFFFRVFPGEDGMVCVRLAILRLAEFAHLQSMAEGLTQPFLGVVPAGVCMRSLINQVISSHTVEPTTVCNVGKLRTIYSTTETNGLVNHHPIPIGMARDDSNYFRSFRPKLEELQRLRKSLGTLLLPMDSTPSPLLRGKADTPQIDCTRIAIQLTRFASRAGGLDSMDAVNNTPNSQLLLCGLGSRIPGLLEYMRDRVMVKVEHFDDMLLPGVKLAKGVDRKDLSDAVFNFGAMIEVLRPSPKYLGLIGGPLESPPMGRKKCSVSRLKDEVLYVLERKIEA